MPEADRYAARRDAKLCVACGVEPAREQRVKCQVCTDRELERQYEVRKERRAARLCPWCGKRKPVREREHCAPCLARGRANNAAYKRR